MNRRELLQAAGISAEVGVKGRERYDLHRFRRGINISHMFVTRQRDAINTDRYAWPPFQGPTYAMNTREFAALRSAGFDFVRLVVSPSIFFDRIDRWPGVLSSIRQAAVEFIAAGFRVVVDIHPTRESHQYTPEALIASPEAPLFTLYTRLVKAIATAFVGLESWCALELLNEPELWAPAGLKAWPAMLRRLISAATTAAPGLALVVSGPKSGGIDGLVGLDMTGIPLGRTYFSFHYYEPHVFTHQGRGGARRFIDSLPWPSSGAKFGNAVQRVAIRVNKQTNLGEIQKLAAVRGASELIQDYIEHGSSPATVKRDFDRVGQWADSHRIDRTRVLLGEFGVAGPWGGVPAADQTSRSAWIQSVRLAAEAQGFPWAFWTYLEPGPFDLVSDVGSRTLSPDFLRVLGLTPATQTGAGV